MTKDDISIFSFVAIACAVLGFAVSITTLNTTSVNGVDSCTFRDIGAIGFGIATLVASSMAEITAVAKKPQRLINLVIGMVCFMVGTFHLLRGFGLVLSPC